MKVIIGQVYTTPLLPSSSWAQREAKFEACKKLQKTSGSSQSVFIVFRQRAGILTILSRKTVNIPEANLILISLWMKF